MGLWVCGGHVDSVLVVPKASDDAPFEIESSQAKRLVIQ